MDTGQGLACGGNWMTMVWFGFADWAPNAAQDRRSKSGTAIVSFMDGSLQSEQV
jgi:hypothetical protein